jgi:hypothetical protein
MMPKAHRPAQAPADAAPTDYLKCLLTSFVISNIET